VTVGRLDAYLAHMREATVEVRHFIEGFTEPLFLADKRTQRPVIMSLVIMGEAATRVVDHHADMVMVD